jgi:N-acetylglucosaminyl-diphospho-decaprenol L-rhamnosyltransferase
MTASVITVTHNSGDVVAGMLRSLPPDVEAIVVDNASTDGSPEIAQAARPDTVVVRLPNNQGFGHGCNVGAGVASGDVLIFLNPDGRTIADALAVLSARVSGNPRSVFGPAFLREDGSPRHDVRRRSQPYHEALELLPSAKRWLPQRLRRDLPDGDRRYTTGGEVDYLQGACLAIDRELFHELGGFDEDFFLYSEEETLCNAVRAGGGQCIYLPDAVIEHVGGTSTARVSQFAVHHFYRSRAIFYRKRYGMVGGLTAGAVIGLGLLVNRCLSPLVRRYGSGASQLEAHSAAFSGLARGVTANLRR